MQVHCPSFGVILNIALLGWWVFEVFVSSTSNNECFAIHDAHLHFSWNFVGDFIFELCSQGWRQLYGFVKNSLYLRTSFESRFPLFIIKFDFDVSMVNVFVIWCVKSWKPQMGTYMTIYISVYIIMCGWYKEFVRTTGHFRDPVLHENIHIFKTIILKKEACIV